MIVSKWTRLQILDHPECWRYDANGYVVQMEYPLRKEFAEGRLFDLCKGVYDKNKDILTTYLVHPEWESTSSRGYTYLLEGSISEQPKPLEVEKAFRVPRNNRAEWQLAKTDPSMIVVSDYDVGKISIKATGGYTDIPLDTESRSEVVTLLGCLDYKQVKPSTIMVDGWYVNAGAPFLQVFRQRSGRSFTPPVIPYSIDEIVMASQPSFDAGLVTSTLASADKACVDLLTAVAEMPESLRSLVLGIKTVAHAVSAFKKKEITISRSFDKRKSMLKRRYEQDVLHLAQLKSKAKTRARKRQLEWQIKRKQDSYSRAVKGTAIEFADAMASVWLNFRYNIMPNVYLLEDLHNLYESYNADFKTTRDKQAGFVTLDGDPSWSPLELEYRENCVIKRGINPDIRFTSLTHANFVTTAWELIPLSFVVDWFVNAGDLLTVSFSPNLSPTQGATFGRKLNFEGTVSNKDTNQQCHYLVKTYRRRVIEPNLLVGISFNWELSLFRQLDALALLWAPIRTLLLSSKR